MRNISFIPTVLVIFAALNYSRINMSLYSISKSISFKVLSFILLSLLLASCGTGKSSLAIKKNTSEIQDNILTYSKKFLGKPYRYGGKGPSSFDCSGYTAFVFGNFGFKLNSSSSGQDRQFPKVARKEDLIVGDLVFFEGRRKNGHVGHVGIVTEVHSNNRFKFIHASTNNGVIISSSTEPYYASRYLRGGRVLDESEIYKRSEKSNQTLDSKTNPPIPSKILTQIKSRNTTEVRNISSTSPDYDIDKVLKNNNGESKGNENHNSVELNSDIIMREEYHLIPPPQKTHIVKMGETLYSISRIYGCTVEELTAWNPHLNNILKVGDKLLVSVK